MDLTWSPAEDAFRAEARAWLADNLAAWHADHGGEAAIASGDTRDGFARHLDWERRLFDAGGGRSCRGPRRTAGATPRLWEWLIFEEEYYRAGGPQRVTQNGIFLLAPTIFEFGTPEQQDRILPRMAAAEDLWCQGWSEPDAGSDLAGIRARATAATSGGWRLDGQKTWTTRGAFCTHLFGLFRTDPDGRAPPRAHLLPRPARHAGRDRARLRPARRRRGLRRGVPRRRVRARRRDVLGEVRPGLARWRWRPPASERGPHAALPGPVPGHGATGSSTCDARADRRRPTRLRDRRRSDAWIDAEAYRWQTFCDRDPACPTGRSIGAGVEPHQDVLVRARRAAARDSRSTCSGTRGRAIEAAVDEGLPVRARRARSTRAPTRSSATSIAERVLGLPRK